MLHKKLTLPQPWADGWSKDRFPKTRRVRLSIRTHLNNELVDVLRQRGIELMMAELFYSSPNMISVIHSDTYANDISKINWIYQDAESKMNWYHPHVVKQLDRTLGHAFIPYNNDEVELIESADLDSPELIQAAVPHNVVNGPGDRWALSLMLKDSKSTNQIAFNDALARLTNVWNIG